MKTYVILSSKTWNTTLVSQLNLLHPANWILIDTNIEFTFDKLNLLNPDKVFIPHWSYIIPAEIYENYECIVFHMTDLPYGRGGSPLQNLIERGHQTTKISALRVVKELDAGDIYLKKELLLLGTAEEVFIRASKVIEEMIAEVLQHNLQPTPQIGEPTVFKRRKPAQSNIKNLQTIEEVFDYIRMLDAENYPHAFLETEHFRFEFSRASLKSNQSILADVRIIQK